MKTLILKPNDGSVIEINGTSNFTAYGDKVMPWSLGVIASLMREQGEEVDFLDAQALELSEAEVQDHIRRTRPERIIATINPIVMKKSSGFNRGWDAEVIYLINKSFVPWVNERANGARVIYGDWFTQLMGHTVTLRDIPLPAYDLLPMKLYNHQQLLASEGCDYHCIFCHFSRLTGRPWMSREIPDIITEFKQLRRYGVRFIRVFDNELTLEPEFAKELLRAMIAENLEVLWETNTRVNNLDEELISLLARAGCIYTGFGLESANEEVMTKNVKQITLDQIREAMHLCRKYNILTRTYALVGLKNDNESTILETFDFLRNDICNSDTTFDLVVPYPNTPYYRYLKKQEKIYQEVSPAHITWIEKEIYGVSGLEQEECQKPAWDYDLISFDEACEIERQLRSKVQSAGHLKKFATVLKRGSSGIKFLADEALNPKRLIQRVWS